MRTPAGDRLRLRGGAPRPVTGELAPAVRDAGPVRPRPASAMSARFEAGRRVFDEIMAVRVAPARPAELPAPGRPARHRHLRCPNPSRDLAAHYLPPAFASYLPALAIGLVGASRAGKSHLYPRGVRPRRVLEPLLALLAMAGALPDPAAGGVGRP